MLRYVGMGFRYWETRGRSSGTADGNFETPNLGQVQNLVCFLRGVMYLGTASHGFLLFDEGGLNDPALVSPAVVLFYRECGQQA